MNFDIGSIIGDYQIVDVLGAGGMGKVYKVRNVISDRIEAMKVLLPDLVSDADLADRFIREIKVQASLDHPNIAGLRTAFRAENQLLMVMEFVEGVTLDEKLREGPLAPELAVEYTGQVLAALDYAHRRGVIHRDIKPANMMLTTGGVVKLMDFGIAKSATDRKLTMTGTTMGSLYYMSPEQIRGDTNLDARADLYSVGVSLYELVTGKRPFDGDSQFAIMAAHLQQAPVPPVQLDPRLPGPLNDLILMSVEKEAGRRFQTAAAFRGAINAVAGMLPPPPVVSGAHASTTPVPPPPVAAPQPMPSIPAVAAIPPAPAPAAGAAAAPQPDYRAIQPTAPEKSKSGKRGLWIALGAVATAAVVIGIIQFGPKLKTAAAPAASVPETSQAQSPATPPSAVQATPPATPPVTLPPAAAAPVAAQQAAPAAAVGRPASGRPAPPARASAMPAAVSQQQTQQQGQQRTPQQPATQPPAAESRPPANEASQAELAQVREHLVMLQTRSSAVRGSLDSLQRSQAASGMSLRGDMQEAASLMDSYLNGSAAALANGDAKSARSFMSKAERQVEKLEKFLGR
jgi:eukaryotic-like serine/threonine-protein kinase